MTNTFPHKKIVVIGAGPGGYTAAFRLADLGQHVTLIDSTGLLGGICLHQGCIPSKTLLHAAKIISEAKDSKSFGIEFESPHINIEKLRQKKNAIIQKFSIGLKFLSDKKHIEFIDAKASFVNSQTIQIEKRDGVKETFTFDNAIIATGSQSIQLKNFPVSKNVLDSASALDLENIPQTLLIIGGGYIGLELGTIYAALGSQVSVVEMTEQLLPGLDEDLIRVLEKRLKSTFKAIHLSTKIASALETPNGFDITLTDNKGKNQTKTFEKILVAVGRKTDVSSLQLQNTKIELTPGGFIKVDKSFQTTDAPIYAIGDITGKPFLAHKASYDAYTVAEILMGKPSKHNAKVIPAVVYTDPEIATCGLTESQAKKENIKITVQSYSWTASGRAMTLDRTDGLTKIIIDPQTEQILGVSIVGVNAGELIMEGVMAVEKNLKVSDLKNLIHPHPSLSETFYEDALNFYGQNVHHHKI